MDLLKAIHNQIQPFVEMARERILILTIGNTGTGKSTLLSSLIYGTDSLEFIDNKIR